MTSAPGYTLTELIHESSVSTVYRGYRNRDRLPVAIKRLKNDRPDPSEIARLRYEYAIAKDVALPGVVKVYGIEKIGANLALILEDAGGRMLDEVIRSRALGTKEALRLAISIANTLESIHRSGVIHLDIKAQNIIVDTALREAKLMDFGSATRLSQDAQRSKGPTAFESTLAYMSPEQTGRVNRLVDSRSDFYSMGVTMYEMVTGQLPFQTADLMELVHSHIARIPQAPHQISPDVPRAVSDIVMKLLAKSPDERYQSAYGLKMDLIECLTQLETTGNCEPFQLGRHDYAGELRIPQKLYGREAELALLEEAWRRTSQGASELLLVSGYAGVGKSLLVNEIHKAIAQSKGYFVTGKFDQLNRTTPHAAVAHAFRELIRTLLTESATALDLWKNKIEAAVGLNGQILIDLIPELALIIGPQPSVPPLGPAEAQNRFHLTFQAFCRTIPAKARPLVIFLDDLQWADPASLKLLQQLLTESGIAHMLVIGAYRDNEVDESHLFSITRAALRKAEVNVHEIKLKPLAFPDVARLIADTFSCDSERTEPLARYVVNKTQGNPFFMNQFMKTLHSDELLSFDSSSMSWTWDLRRIEGMDVTDNVVDFMAGKLRQLTESTQRVVTLAACIGYQFDLKTLSTVNKKSLHETARELSEALHEGLILAISAESRFFDIAMDGETSEPDLTFDVFYRFLHDRVQQAAYSLIDDADKQEVHLQIGRLLLAKSGRDPGEDELFKIVGHMNLGAALIADPQERLALARLNLAAGARAKSGSAYEAATNYFEAGVSMLGPQSWEEEYDLAFASHTGLAECRCLSGQLSMAEPLFDTLLSTAKSRLQRAQVHNLRMSFYLMLGKLADVVTCGLEALALLGIGIPEATEERAALLSREMDQMRSYLAEHKIADFLDLPVVADPEKLLVFKLLADLTMPAAALAIPALPSLLSVMQINLSAKHGTTNALSYACVTYALLLIDGVLGQGTTQDRYRDAYEFAKLGVELNERLPNARLTCMLLVVFSATLHFFEPLRDAIKSFERARHAGLELGDLTYSSYCCFHIVSARLNVGDDLDSIDEEIEQGLALMRRTNDKMTTFILTNAKQIVANLKGRTANTSTLSDDSFDEPSFLSTIEAPELIYVASWYYTFKAQLAYLYRDYGAARSFLVDAEKSTVGWSKQAWSAEVVFYACLILAASYDEASVADKEQYMETIAARQGELAEWAKLCPRNYAHKHLLVSAEVARISGREQEASMLYDKAIDAAQAAGATRDEAMACEMFARFHLANGRVRCARAFMTEAYRGYLHWGATAKADRLAFDMPHLVQKTELAPVQRNVLESSGSTVQVTSTTKLSTNVLDVEALIRSAQAIAGEVVLENVVKQLMDIAIKNAGAQRGVLILERNQHLMIEAIITVDLNMVTLGQSIPLETSAEVPLTIVQYVARTTEPVVLADAKQEPRFALDPYIVARNPRSILCLAMVHKGNKRGILYLENNTANDVFTPSRTELSKLLLAQAATAVENALLYDHLHSRTEALREAEEHIRMEFAAREQSEQARATLQEEIIRVQNARLAELSTPIIPITDRIMVMPLIGQMDGQRAQQVLRTALQGVESKSTDVVIIDITGVRTVDSDVAATLIKTASALKLLGAQAVITGIRSEVAQTLTCLQIDFGAVVTRGTLQSGIGYALQRTGSSGSFPGARML
jgi:predicted ATPase/GAF domain-containing protein/tRNA A-37 threonylcarbamoyl transferase component Bud32